MNKALQKILLKLTSVTVHLPLWKIWIEQSFSNKTSPNPSLPGREAEWLLISSSLAISSILILTTCDHKVEQRESKKLSENLEPLSKPAAKKQTYVKNFSPAKLPITKVSAKKVSKNDAPIANIKVEKYQQNRVVRSATDLAENLIAAEEKQPEPIILNLSLNLDIEEKNHPLESVNRKQLQGIFEFKEDILNINMEAYFEWPHNENQEQEITPDGAGVGFRVGI